MSAVALLLRHLRDEDDGAQPSRSQSDHRFAGASDATRVLSLILIPLLVSLGVYLALHGALTPGRGFQAGVVLAAGPLVISCRAIPRSQARGSAVGAGCTGRGRRHRVCADRAGWPDLRLGVPRELPAAGHLGHLVSAGMMPLSSIAVGLEVTGAFLLTWTEFLDQDLLVERGEL